MIQGDYDTYLIKTSLQHYISRLSKLKDNEDLENVTESIWKDINAEKEYAQNLFNNIKDIPYLRELDDMALRHGKLLCNALRVYQGDLKTTTKEINVELHGAEPKYELVNKEIKLIESLVNMFCNTAE